MNRHIVGAWLMVVHQGCAYRAVVSTEPGPALVELPNGQSAVLSPSEVVFRWVPFNRQPITVTLDGYRPVTIDVRKSEVRMSRFITTTLSHPATLFGAPRGSVRVVLVPEHGPVGTWTADDVP